MQARAFVSVVLLIGVAQQGECLGKGEFEVNEELIKKQPKDFFVPVRANAHVGGFDRGDEMPARSRLPQPTYDNRIYGAPNYFQHELVYLEGDLVLDWQPSNGQYRIYKLSRSPGPNCPAIPEVPINSGFWPNRRFHKLIYIGCDGAPPGGKMFDYDPDRGHYEIVRFNHKADPNSDPMMETLSSGFRREIMNFQPVFMNDDEILFYEKQTGQFSVYYINNQLPSKVDPIQPTEPINYGKMQGLHEVVLYIGKNTILDYDPLFGRYWIYHYDRTAVNNTSPFVGPLSSGTIQKNIIPTYMADEQMVFLDTETGQFAFANISRPQDPDAYEMARNPDAAEKRRVEAALIMNEDKLKTGHDFGFGSLIVSDQCRDQPNCRSCLGMNGCGWCATSKRCKRGNTVMPCSGNCTSWQPVFCEAEPCSQHRGCSNCLGDPFCGWCEDSLSCTEGVGTGPLFGACDSWSKVSCPKQGGFGSGGDQPCVEGGVLG